MLSIQKVEPKIASSIKKTGKYFFRKSNFSIKEIENKEVAPSIILLGLFATSTYFYKSYKARKIKQGIVTSSNFEKKMDSIMQIVAEKSEKIKTRCKNIIKKVHFKNLNHLK